jgi:hypothetical protein
MATAERGSTDEGTLPGALNYLDEYTESSLFRNGKVLTRRDVDGSDAKFIGVNLKSYTLGIHNARDLHGDARKTCALNGFELLDAPLENPSLDFLDHQQVVGNYYRECEQLVAASTGAQAFAFDHNIRSALGKRSSRRIAGGQNVQGPAKLVHGDYTLYSGPQRLRDLANPPGVNDTLRNALPEGQSLISQAMVEASLAEGGRFAIINVWRNIADEPVQSNPMAMCDGQTVEPEDLVTFEIHYADRIGENYFAKYSTRHRFYCYPQLTRDEPMLLKQWDSDGGLARSRGRASDASFPGAPCTFSFHSAFDDLLAPDDAPDRWSIEVRCLVIY